MDLKGKDLEEWFLSQKGKATLKNFPHKENYVLRYEYLSEQFYTKIHPFVMQGAAYKDGVFLNDHGKEHIKTVIQRSSELVCTKECCLTHYEVYILLMAIHVHDVGNILGRNGHEFSSTTVLRDYAEQAGQDRIEWDCIFDIAEAHGGEPKDKISNLVDEKILNCNVRKQLLASILKFADELSDDRSRANRFMLTTIDSNTKKPILPEEGLLFHKYSYCLHTVDIDLSSKCINLKFDIEEDDLKRKYKKPKKGEEGKFLEQYLIQEIFERTYKSHLERIYCSRFMRTYINLNVLVINIEITLNKRDARNKRIKKSIRYILGEVGYPQSDHDDIFKLCPELKDYTGEKIVEFINN
ncbi:HD domain-containing protein [Viscerimonas tarda]